MNAAGQRPRKPVRLAIFTMHPIQYQAPLFRELASRPELAPGVFFASRHGLDDTFDKGFGKVFRWDIPLLEGYEHRFLENRARSPNVYRFAGIHVPGIRQAWQDGAFDAALVLGWQSRGHLQAMRAARDLDIPLVVRGDSHLGMRPASLFKATIRRIVWLPVRELIYRRMFAVVDGFLAVGSRNADFYRHFGVDDDRIWLAPHSVDNHRFDLPPDQRADARAERRAQLNVVDEVLFASVAKLLPRKRPFDLLDAFRLLVTGGARARLAFLGEGPERRALERRIASYCLQDCVSIVGFVNQRAIPSWLAAADCLVLPSDWLETWGLAVNEAMAAGLPVVVSDAVGCAPDLVHDGVNGFTFPLGDVAALHRRLASIVAACAAERDRMANHSRQLIAHCTVSHVADTLIEALGAISRRRATA